MTRYPYTSIIFCATDTVFHPGRQKKIDGQALGLQNCLTAVEVAETQRAMKASVWSAGRLSGSITYSGRGLSSVGSGRIGAHQYFGG